MKMLPKYDKIIDVDYEDITDKLRKLVEEYNKKKSRLGLIVNKEV